MLLDEGIKSGLLTVSRAVGRQEITFEVEGFGDASDGQRTTDTT